MRITAVLTILLLVGCGGSNDESSPQADNNHGYGYEYDVAGATGLRLRYTPTLKAGDYYADIAFYESEFERVQDCTGISAQAPFVIVVKPEQLPAHFGYYYSDPSLIVIHDIVALVAFRHEAIHYLLDVSTGDLDPEHLSPLFSKC